MSALKVGDEVILSAVGRDTYARAANNPHNISGKVISIGRSLLMPVCVEWENGRANCYKEVELQLRFPKPEPAPKAVPTLEQLQGTVLKLQRKARKAAELYNAELAKQQAALGRHINLQLLADIEESK